MHTIRARFRDEGIDGVRKSYGATVADLIQREVDHKECSHALCKKTGNWPECPVLSVLVKTECLEVLNKTVANNANRLTLDEMVERLRQDFGSQAAAYWLLSKTGEKT